MDTRILVLLFVCVTLAACKHGKGGKKGRKDLERELLELRAKHGGKHGHNKGKKEREETLADLEALLARSDDEDSDDMQRRDDSDMNAEEDEDERSEDDRSEDDIDERSEDTESEDLDLLSLLARRVF